MKASMRSGRWSAGLPLLSLLAAGCNEPPNIERVGYVEIAGSLLEEILGASSYVYFDAFVGEPLTFDIVASDPDGDPLTWSVAPLPYGATFDDETHTFSWTPTEADASRGGAAIYVVVEDDRGAWTGLTVNIYLSYPYEEPTIEPEPKRLRPEGDDPE